MRALHATLAFLVATAGLMARADAHVPLWAPRVSLSLALDWNKLAREAISRPRAVPVSPVSRRRVPHLPVTGAAAPTLPPRDVQAYARTQEWMRVVLMPHYVQPEPERRQMFRALYVTPFTPYLGAYGLMLTVENNALLR